MRSLPLKFLLLAMWLNMACGMAWHEALHWRAAAAELQAAAQTGTAPPAQQDTGEEEGEAAHALCAACHAHAQLAAGAPGPGGPALPPAAARAALPPAEPPQVVLPGPGRWRFASRDPPVAA